MPQRCINMVVKEHAVQVSLCFAIRITGHSHWHHLPVWPWTTLLNFFICQTRTIMTGYLTSEVYRFTSQLLSQHSVTGWLGSLKIWWSLCFPFARVDGASPQVSQQFFHFAFCCCDESVHISPRKCMLSKKEKSAGKGLIFCKIRFAGFTRCRKLLILYTLVP